MKFFKHNSRVQMNVNIADYMIDWERVVSKPQKKVKDFLRPYWSGHVILEEFRIPGTKMRIDILNLTRRYVVEVSPSGSHSFNAFFHKNRFKFRAAMGRDIKKAEWCEQNDFTVIEVGEEDLNCLSEEWFLKHYDITL